MTSDSPITMMLDAARDGNEEATEQLFIAVYNELKRVAGSHRRRWKGNETLNTTALVHEAFIKLSGPDEQSFANRTHFYATASKAMRHILVNYAERQSAAKRGGDAVQVPFEDRYFVAESSVDEVLGLHELLALLEKENSRQCQVVECRIFGGMTIEETAEALQISTATVARDWQSASAWLYSELARRGEDSSQASSEYRVNA